MTVTCEARETENLIYFAFCKDELSTDEKILHHVDALLVNNL
jgi:hypothetical protein